MGHYTIEKGIPVKEKRSGGGLKYPFEQMQVGDSFSAPFSKYQSLNGSARAYEALNHGVKFTMRKMSPTECRIWRIS